MTTQKQGPYTNKSGSELYEDWMLGMGQWKPIDPAYPETVREVLAANARAAGFDFSGHSLSDYMSLEPKSLKARAEEHETIRVRLLVKLEESLAYYPYKK